MESKELTIRIKIQDIEPLETLMEVLCRHLDELPSEVYEAVMSVVDYENEVE